MMMASVAMVMVVAGLVPAVRCTHMVAGNVATNEIIDVPLQVSHPNTLAALRHTLAPMFSLVLKFSSAFLVCLNTLPLSKYHLFCSNIFHQPPTPTPLFQCPSAPLSFHSTVLPSCPSTDLYGSNRDFVNGNKLKTKQNNR